ncbi:putative peptidase M48 [Streptomyces sp. Tu6071]|nr:putative peptidase M48 [Streptomyces sp. Tu6071]
MRVLAEEAGTRAPACVLLTADVNAAVSERARLLGLVPGPRALYLGLALLQARSSRPTGSPRASRAVPRPPRRCANSPRSKALRLPPRPLRPRRHRSGTAPAARRSLRRVRAAARRPAARTRAHENRVARRTGLAVRLAPAARRARAPYRGAARGRAHRRGQAGTGSPRVALGRGGTGSPRVAPGPGGTGSQRVGPVPLRARRA